MLNSLRNCLNSKGKAINKLLIFSVVILIAVLTYAGDKVSVGTITVLMDGFRNDKGLVHVALFNAADGFPIYHKKAYKSTVTTVKNKKSEAVFTDVPYGIYAVSVLHDENSNGTMDLKFGMFPKEGYAASNNAKSAIGTPSFKSAQFELNAPSKIVNIKINY